MIPVLTAWNIVKDNWRIAVVVVVLTAIFAHAFFGYRKVARLKEQVAVYEAAINEYRRLGDEQAKKAVEQVKVVEKLVYIEDKKRKEADEQIKVIYRDNAEARDWASTPVPSAVADRLRDY
jgi:uncharacterized membrane protein (DUF106 family)